MAIQPSHHWQFNERDGSITTDKIAGAQGKLDRVTWTGHGRIGNAVLLNGNKADVNFGNQVGQFGTSDFTIAFGMKNISTHGESDMNIIGNRVSSGHDNFLALRLIKKSELFFEVDQDKKGKHYVADLKVTRYVKEQVG